MLKKLLLNKKVTYSGRRRSVSLHAMQLEEAGIEVGEEVEVYVKGKKIIIEKKES
jgi:antitoxin component of MazEF toxin-antitoxin module